ncbi:hypothetical protein Gpo141_00009896 [Globisporangium polare]
MASPRAAPVPVAVLPLVPQADSIEDTSSNATPLAPPPPQSQQRDAALLSPAAQRQHREAVDATAAAVTAAADPGVEREIRAFLDAFERASVSEFAGVSTSLASTVSVSASLPDVEALSSLPAANAEMLTAVADRHLRQASSPYDRRLSIDSMELEKVGDVYVFLLELQQKLKRKQTFQDEDERTKWWWLVHQLKQQRQAYPEKWDSWADSYLARIEVAITNLPVAAYHDSNSSGGNDNSDLFTDSSSTELRISISDIPMLESNSTKSRVHQRRMSGEAEEDTSWASFSRIVRAASGRTMRAIIGSNERDSELFSTGNSGGGSGRGTGHTTGIGTRSRSGSNGTDSRESIPTMQRSSSSFSQSVPNLLRSVVSYLGLSMEETFMCQICFEYVSVGKSFRLSKCGHLFCEACLENYLQFKIGEGQVYPTCFHENEGEPACAAEIVPEDIKAVVSHGSWEKYLRFKFNKENENARQCPFCDHSQVYRGSEAPECLCESCGGEFCFVHSTAHRGRSCAEYEKKIVAIEKLNHAMINEISKPCPGCNNFVEKIGGCNQMKCVVCSTSFCWICCEIIDDTVFPEHFQWWNIRGCPGNQMAEVEEQSASQTISLKLLRGLFFLVFGPPAFVLALVFSLLCCCCAPCTKLFDTTYRNAFTTCLCASGYLLLAPFALALGLVCSPCLCCVYWFAPDTFAGADSVEVPGVSMQETQTDVSPNNESIFRESV